jgi:predicted enzyme related to lactoylglutathione lyase
LELLVNLDVLDLEEAIRFYGAAFGLTVGRRFGPSGAEMLGTDRHASLGPRSGRILSATDFATFSFWGEAMTRSRRILDRRSAFNAARK